MTKMVRTTVPKTLVRSLRMRRSPRNTAPGESHQRSPGLGISAVSNIGASASGLQLSEEFRLTLENGCWCQPPCSMGIRAVDCSQITSTAALASLQMPWPTLAAVEHRDDLQMRVAHSLRNDILCRWKQDLTGRGHPTGTSEIQQLRQEIDCGE